MTKSSKGICFALATVAAGLLCCSNVLAANIAVTTASGGIGGAECSLRDAITAANQDVATGACPAGDGTDTITLQAHATYTLTEADNETDGPNGLPSIASAVTIEALLQPCVGDCDENGVVSVNETVICVRIALGTSSIGVCPSIDANDDGIVTIEEPVRAVNSALSGCVGRFIDHGDGTITDMQTGLMWEKKGDDDSIHDVDGRYTWTDNSDADLTNPDGTAFTDFLATLNQAAFAGHGDWRMPDLDELESIVDHEHFDPAVNPVFDQDCQEGCSATDCSCTIPSGDLPSVPYIYWSETTDLGNEGRAWSVEFTGGGVGTDPKTGSFAVRAVRGGFEGVLGSPFQRHGHSSASQLLGRR